MRMAAAVLFGILTLACAACGKKAPTGGTPEAPPPATDPPNPAPDDSSPPAGATGKAFLDNTKDVPAKLEWNRDIHSVKGGAVVFRVASDAPFAVTVVADRSYQALLKGNKAGLNKSDLLLTVDGKPPSYEGRVTVPPGRTWFIIENRSAAPALVRLECFPGK